MTKILDVTKLLGATMLFLGSAMSLTLWLLPLGLPLALVGVAMLSAPK